MGNKRMHFKVSVVALAAVLGMTAVAGEIMEHFAAVRADPNCHAVMYTSWSDDYRNLARFAELSRKGGK